MIPKTIYRTWFSDTPIPDCYQWTKRTFLDYNPDFEVIDITLKTLPPLINQKLFDRSPFNARKADLARVEIIYQWGGIYADMDMVCLKSLQNILSFSNAFTGMGTPHDIGNAFFGAEKHDPWLLDMIEYFSSNDFPDIPKSIPEFTRTGIAPFYYCTQKHSHVQVFPFQFFYPVPPAGRNNIEQYDLSNSYTVHLWHGVTNWIPELSKELRKE